MESHQRRGINGHQLGEKNSCEPGGIPDHTRRFSDSIKFFVSVSVFLTALCFAYASFVVSKCVDTPDQCLAGERGLLSTLHFSDNSARYASLRAEIASESKAFEFMVWDRERTNLSKTLLPLQYQRINLQPLNDELWLELNYLNQNAGVTHSDRSWALNRSDELVGWNHEQSAKLVHYCVNEFELYGQVVTSSCVKNLVHLPANWSLGRMAKKSKLSGARLERARSEALKILSTEAP